MDRLLRGEIPSGGNCDIKTLARQAGVDRTAFYGGRPYAHLRIEFEQRLQQLQPTDIPRPEDHADRTAEGRRRQAQNPPGTGEHDNRSTHRLSNPGTGTVGRATRRDPPSPRCRPPEGQRHLPARATAEDHRPMLTQHNQVMSITVTARLSPHARPRIPRTRDRPRQTQHEPIRTRTLRRKGAPWHGSLLAAPVGPSLARSNIATTASKCSKVTAAHPTQGFAARSRPNNHCNAASVSWP